MIHVLVNADDFGLDENRSMAILDAYNDGWITTTTAIVTMPWFNKAIALSRKLPLYDNIGLHLNLTEGKPLTEAIQKSPLFCDEDGNFNAYFHHTKKYRLWLPEFERRAVQEEIEAQLTVYCQSGLCLFHLDSHHHVHTDLSIATLLLPLAKKAGFRTIRRSRNIGKGLTCIKRLYKYFINEKLKHSIRFNADYFCDFYDFENVMNSLADNCIVEIMTHPLYSLENRVDMRGTLTEYHGDFSYQKAFWKKFFNSVKLIDYKSIH